MKIRSILVAAALVALSVSPAKAMYSGNTEGSSPTQYVVAPASALFYVPVFDTLDANTKLEFTFTAVNAKLDSALVMGSGFTNDVSATASASSSSPVSPLSISEDLLITAAANIVNTPSSTAPYGTSVGTAVITNLKAVAINVQILLNAIVKGAGSFTYSWKTTTVPLPAALPLFGLGLASLAGYRARKRKA